MMILIIIMDNEIKTLKSEKQKSPPFWTMFLDGTNPPSFSYSRMVGFMVITTFMIMVSYLSITTESLIIPSKEWVYIIVSFSLMKPLQRFAESKDNESQLNYDFQMAQLDSVSLKDKK